MLPEWYFCSCIKADPDKTAIFLQILGSLAEASQNPELASIGLAELQRLDPWMQGYVLPAVLRAIGPQGPPRELYAALDRYFADLSEIMPEKLIPSFEELKTALLLTSGSGELLNEVRRFLRCFPGKGPLGTPSTIPYMDLRDFFPETLILAVLADRLEDDRSFSSLLEESDEAFDILAEMLETALHHNLGRLQADDDFWTHKLSAELLARFQLEDVIWWAPSGYPELEWRC